VLTERVRRGKFVLDRELRDAAALAHKERVPRHQ